MIPTTAARASAVPRSGCPRINRNVAPSIARGTKLLFQKFSILILFLLKKAAVKIIRTSLLNSEGCMVKPPTAIQRLASLISTPTPGIYTTSSSTKFKKSITGSNLRHFQ